MAWGHRKASATMLTLRRSGRVAEGGALLRRYVGEYLHRGFESLLLRWRGGRAVECGGLENRYPSLGGSRVQIPPPPLHQAETSTVTPDVGLGRPPLSWESIIQQRDQRRAVGPASAVGRAAPSGRRG